MIKIRFVAAQIEVTCGAGIGDDGVCQKVVVAIAQITVATGFGEDGVCFEIIVFQ